MERTNSWLSQFFLHCLTDLFPWQVSGSFWMSWYLRKPVLLVPANCKLCPVRVVHHNSCSSSVPVSTRILNFLLSGCRMYCATGVNILLSHTCFTHSVLRRASRDEDFLWASAALHPNSAAQGWQLAALHPLLWILGLTTLQDGAWVKGVGVGAGKSL